MPTYTDQLQPLTLPAEPTQGQDEPAADFHARHAAWWRTCDVLLRQQCQAARGPMMDAVSGVLAGTVEALDRLDAAIGAAAAAIAPRTASEPAAGSDGQVSEATFLEALRIIKGVP